VKKELKATAANRFNPKNWSELRGRSREPGKRAEANAQRESTCTRGQWASQPSKTKTDKTNKKDTGNLGDSSRVCQVLKRTGQAVTFFHETERVRQGHPSLRRAKKETRLEKKGDHVVSGRI